MTHTIVSAVRYASRCVLLLTLLTCATLFAQTARYVPFELAKPVLTANHDALPPALTPVEAQTAATWDKWVRQHDAEIRTRLDQGEEDTLTNLLRLGVTYTKEYRITTEYLVRYGESSLVNSFAETRAKDLIAALSAPHLENPGMAEMRALLEKKGFTVTTPKGKAAIKAYLLKNLARMKQDVIRAQQEAKQGNAFESFKDRGISTDTSLWPDFLLHEHLRRMVEKSVLKPKSVRRVAIVGPGLDFVNKEGGLDFYPPQTVQPFSVIDMLSELGIADPAGVRIVTYDISQRVNVHIEQARKNAAAGKPYTVQIPWNPNPANFPPYMAAAESYWKQIGAHIGAEVPALPVPEGAGDARNRAVRFAPDVVQRITPYDANVVFQNYDLPAGDRFDLIIGTNIFIYYDRFEQALARVNLTTMLQPGGFLLSNDALPNAPGSHSSDALQTELTVREKPALHEYMFSYQREH